MYNPKDVLTERGVIELGVHLYNMNNAIFFLLNHADDLGIGALDEKQLDILHDMKAILDSDVYKNGDGEKYDRPY